jgi:hypothetical protein
VRENVGEEIDADRSRTKLGRKKDGVIRGEDRQGKAASRRAGSSAKLHSTTFQKTVIFSVTN